MTFEDPFGAEYSFCNDLPDTLLADKHAPTFWVEVIL